MKICRCLLCGFVTYDPVDTKKRYEDAESFMRKHLATKHGIHATKLTTYRRYYVVTHAPPQLEKILRDKRLKRIFIRTFKTVTSL